MSERRRTLKGTQTRDSLKLAAATALEHLPFHQSRITDVTKEAGVATGFCYHYFEDLSELISANYYGALFLENPPEDRIHYWPQLLEMTRGPHKNN